MTTSTSPLHRLSASLYRRRRLRLGLLLGLPVLWLVGVYGGSLVSLLTQSFFRIDTFSGTVDRSPTLQTWQQVFTDANMAVAGRTIGMAAAVTIAAVAVGFPLAYYIARYTSGKTKSAMVLAVLIPLWSSYLVRVYSWKLILAAEGIVSWASGLVGMTGVLGWILDLPVIGGPSLSTSTLGQFIVFVYIWLPYMILPIQAAVERVPRSFLEASADLGGRPATTFRRVVWPLALPGVAAGSIFTFSLTLGDYIIPTVIGDSSPFIGLAIYSQQGVAGNLPLAAALSFIPIVVMALYLTGARKMGAFEAL
ncbi:MAG: ABC transporter permease [Acidimicrobiia bacterium]|nr:ABC transporter permease [Acidimicrobiia bacterium]MDH4308413.1 ABC transporter permease [Acidimicrobiia bacterium]MDH5292611.1 ABC transporter permease [Acidimicrobiia bacterium]